MFIPKKYYQKKRCQDFPLKKILMPGLDVYFFDIFIIFAGIKIINSCYLRRNFMKASKSKIKVPKKVVNFNKLSIEENDKSFQSLLEGIINDNVQSSTKFNNDPFDEYKVIVPRQGKFWDNGYEDIEINSAI